MRTFRRFMFVLSSGALLVSGGLAEAASGRQCVRRTELCWDCADIQFPAQTPCGDASACSAGQLCVDQSSVPTCFTPTYVCCDQAPCERPPQCPSAASSCSGDGGFTEACTFLNACPAMDASVRPDAGRTDAGVDGAAPDGGSVTAPDGSTSPKLDAATPPPSTGTPDGCAAPCAPEADAGDDAASAPADDGCGCSMPGAAGASVGSFSVTAWAVLALARRRARRRSNSRDTREGRGSPGA